MALKVAFRPQFDAAAPLRQASIPSASWRLRSLKRCVYVPSFRCTIDYAQDLVGLELPAEDAVYEDGHGSTTD